MALMLVLAGLASRMQLLLDVLPSGDDMRPEYEWICVSE